MGAGRHTKIIYLLVFCPLFMAACVSGNKTNVSALQAYMPISETACADSVGINGKWQLVNIHQDERNFAPATDEQLVVTDCSHIAYYTDGQFVRKESFHLLRVLSYCSDYQLNYIGKNDSVSCINMRKDTLIFGDCSTFETSRYFYKKIAG